MAKDFYFDFPNGGSLGNQLFDVFIAAGVLKDKNRQIKNNKPENLSKTTWSLNKRLINVQGGKNPRISISIQDLISVQGGKINRYEY